MTKDSTLNFVGVASLQTNAAARQWSDQRFQIAYLETLTILYGCCHLGRVHGFFLIHLCSARGGPIVPCSLWNSCISRWAWALFPCLRYKVANPKCVCAARAVSVSSSSSLVHAFSAAAASPSSDAALPSE